MMTQITKMVPFHVKNIKLSYVCIVFIILYCPFHEAHVLSFDHQGCLRPQDVETNGTILSPSVVHCSSLCGNGCIAVIFENDISSPNCALIYGGPADVPKSSAVACGSSGATGQVWLKELPYSGPKPLPREWPCKQGLQNRTVVSVTDDVQVLCDMETDGGGWMVIQHRSSADVDFSRDWENYKSGFGDLAGNFWMGLEYINFYTTLVPCEVRFDMQFNGTDYIARYGTIKVFDEAEKYKLHIADFNKGDNAGNSMWYHDDMPFSTKDKDNDVWQESCAKYFPGGWWFRTCVYANLNGGWGKGQKLGVFWGRIDTLESVSYSEIKIRPQKL